MEEADDERVARIFTRPTPPELLQDMATQKRQIQQLAKRVKQAEAAMAERVKQQAESTDSHEILAVVALRAVSSIDKDVKALSAWKSPAEVTVADVRAAGADLLRAISQTIEAEEQSAARRCERCLAEVSSKVRAYTEALSRLRANARQAHLDADVAHARLAGSLEGAAAVVHAREAPFHHECQAVRQRALDLVAAGGTRVRNGACAEALRLPSLHLTRRLCFHMHACTVHTSARSPSSL